MAGLQFSLSIYSIALAYSIFFCRTAVIRNLFGTPTEHNLPNHWGGQTYPDITNLQVDITQSGILLAIMTNFVDFYLVELRKVELKLVKKTELHYGYATAFYQTKREIIFVLCFERCLMSMSGTWSFNPTAKIHSGICSPLDFTISNLTDNSQSKDGLFSVARYSRPYDIASPTGFADDKIYVTDFGRIRLSDQELQRVTTVYQTSGQGMLDRLGRMNFYGEVMYLGGSMNIIMLAPQNYTELRNFPCKDCETVIPLSSSVILAAKTYDFVLEDGISVLIDTDTKEISNISAALKSDSFPYGEEQYIGNIDIINYIFSHSSTVIMPMKLNSKYTYNLFIIQLPIGSWHVLPQTRLLYSVETV